MNDTTTGTPARRLGQTVMENRSLKKNQLCMVIDAIGWPLGQSFLAPQTILAVFVARLTGSNLGVGLVGSVQSLCQLVPQFVASGWIERLKRTRGYVVTVGILFERLPLLVLVGAILWDPGPRALLYIFFACWALANLGGGINMPAFMALFSKAIPTERRGRVIGFGTSIGTLLAAGGAILARRILSTAAGLTGYAWCFLLGFVILMITVIPLGLVDEPAQTLKGRRSFIERLREVPVLLKGQRGFSKYILLQIALQFTLSGIVFVTSYAVLTLGAGGATIALGSGIMMASNAVFSLLFGLLGDRRGYRPVFRVTALSSVALFVLMAGSPSIGLVYTAYAMAGAILSGVLVGSNMTMEFAGPHRTATFTAIVFTAVAPARIGAPLLCGWLADRVGLPAVFALNAGAGILALYLSLFRMTDIRAVSD